MAGKKTKEEQLADKSVKELEELLKKTEKEWFKLKMELKTNRLKDVHGPRSKRKEISRIKTIMREKELARVTKKVKEKGKK